MGVVGRLLVLLAVLLMPVGMEPAARSAPPMDLHSMSAAMPKGHCPDQPKDHNGLATCSVVCASTLPAQEQARTEPIPATSEPVRPMPAPMLHGIHLEIATPPPKLT